MVMDELQDWLALHRLCWSHPKAVWEAVLRAGSVSGLLHGPRRELRSIFDTDWTVIEQLRCMLDWCQVDRDLAVIQKRGITVTPRGSTSYPSRLSHIPDPPLLLFWRGRLYPHPPSSFAGNSLSQGEGGPIAIVGSRKSTAYGREAVETIVPDLVSAGSTIVSGLAYGIDAHAHRAALTARGTTIAVLASGVDDITPHGHQKLGELIMEDGALCSEIPLGISAHAHQFPFRNRIISGLSDAILIVEAEVKSGSLVTAGHAADQGRSVFAIPGPITSPLSAGCHQLIKDGASPCTCAADLLGVDKNCGHPEALDDTTSRLLKTLSTGPCTANQLGDRLQMPIAQILQRITALECAGMLRVLPGGLVARN